jgi:O-antigen/teichoic acid export membrane protein
VSAPEPPIREADAAGAAGLEAAPEARRKSATFGADVMKLVSGATFAQLSSVLVAPIISRLYGPEDLGLLTLFNSIVGIITIIVCMRYELSIVLPEKDEEAVNLLGVSLLSALLMSVLTVPIVVFGKSALIRLVKAPDLAGVLWMAPPTVLFTGFFLALTYWSSRTRRFGRVSVSRVSSSAATSAIQVAAGGLGYADGSSLVGASLAGTAFGTVLLGGQTLRDDGRLLRRALRWKGIREGMYRHRKFFLYGTGSSLLNQISWQLPAFLLQGYFSTAVVGFYALGNRVLRMPMSLIGSAIGQVFYQRSAEALRSGELAESVESAFRRLVVVSLLPLIVLTVIGQEAFGLVFGSRWLEAGYYAQVLSPWTFFWFISSPLSTLFAVIEKQEFGLKMNTLIFGSRLAALMVGGRLHDARLAILLFSASGVLVYGYYTFAILHASGVNIPRVARFLAMRFLEYVPAIAILLVLKAIGAAPWMLIAASVALIAVYGVRAVRSDPAMAMLWKNISPF